jgi:hypothetical protein
MNPQAIAHEMKAAQDLCRQIEPLAARVNGFDKAAAYEAPGRGEDPGRDEQRVARQEEPEEQARLGKDDDCQHQQAAPLDEAADVVELVNQLKQPVEDGVPA